MKPKTYLRILLVFLLSFLVFSCLKDDELLENPKNEVSTSDPSQGGKKLYKNAN